METRISDETMDAVLTKALERAPAPVIPADFAARVRASLPAQAAPRRGMQAGRAAAIAAAAVLVVALFVLAPHAQPGLSSLNFYIELLMLAELLGIAYWLAAQQSLRG